jgi:RNA-binding protein 23/39
VPQVPLVLQFSNTVPDFQKFPIMVKASEAEKNYLAKEEKAAASASASAAGGGGSPSRTGTAAAGAEYC